MAHKAAEILSKKLNTVVRVNRLRYTLLNHITLEGLYVEDQNHDTLVYAGEAQVRITDWFIFRKQVPVLHYIGLHNAYANLYRTDTSSIWNYQFIIDAFSSPKKTGKKQEIKIDLKKLDLQQVRFHMDDAWVGNDMNFDVGSLLVTADNIDFDKKLVDVSKIATEKLAITLRDYKGGRPADTTHKRKNSIIDTTAFNPDKWAIKLHKLTLENCFFNLETADDTAKPGEFDATHLLVNDINASASDIIINGDTLHGQIDKLAAKERCGLQLKEAKAKVTVSPNASICEQLTLTTNNSKITNSYYAMLYKRFPDFTSYITNVIMDTRLKDASVDVKDIAYFAPALKQFSSVLRVSGEAKGTVADITAKHLQITDGKSFVKGNIKMKGLPDIYKTLINFDDGEIITTGEGILKYVPTLKNDPNIAIEKLLYVYFNGNYNGYIENFALNGMLKTNLGSIQSNVKMNVPGFSSNKAVYSGTIISNSFELGTLLRQPDLGSVSLNATINGISFDPEHAQINTNANISQLFYHGYNYKNISAEGLLAKKQFNGKLLVNDSNLALAFYGTLDFSQKQVVVNAKANLLKSNFYLLHLTKDTVQAVADLDLNCTGSSIDSFLGYIKLFNIDIKRNQRRLNLDSVYVNSTKEDGRQKLTVQSNDVTANIKGDYQLTKLPYSVQYYLSKYLPNYIKQPSKTAPEQNLTFEIQTRHVDSLLGVTTKIIRGFDNSSVKGSLNTFQKKLTLTATSPYGIISNYSLHNVSLNADGNFNQLALNTEIETVVVGDSFLKGSLSVTTTIGNDSVHFNLATTAPEAYTSAALSGQIVAKGDSLYLSLAPSEFFLSQTKWNIPSGNYVVYSNNYLLIKNLRLESGLQKINITTQREGPEQAMAFEISNLDLAQFGNMGGFAVYQPDGRIDGTLTIDKLFSDIDISSNLKATNVKLAADTLGNVVLIGNYDGKKKMISLDPQTGIYNGSTSITASGDMSFYKGVNEQIKGSIQLTNVPLSWGSTFLAGFISHISGTTTGTVNITGSSQLPDIAGKLQLSNLGMKVDFLGTYYQTPEGSVAITNNKIDFGNITLYDKFKNTALLTGSFRHDHFKDMTMDLRISSSQFQVFDLHEDENQIFYGNLIAAFNPLTIRGPFNNVVIRINNAVATQKSHIYLPITSDNGLGSYSYVSFKTYGKEQPKLKKDKSKLDITINSELNDLVEMTLVLDPTTGDAINAKGTGDISLQIPANNEIKMHGKYTIDEGDYTFTLKKVLFRKTFVLSPNSSISFNGPFSQTAVNVDALYTVRARLYDLLSDAEKQSGFMPSFDITDAKTPQDINVILHMRESLSKPNITFSLSLPENRSVGTYAYTKLERLNDNSRELFDQVASLLLVGSLVPPEGLSSGAAKAGAISNVSEIISGTASSQITNLVNKILGNKDLAIDLKYVSYNLSYPNSSGGGSVDRNQASLSVRKNYFNDRLIVEVGGKSDWGKPASTSNTSNTHLAGDFRIQYLLSQGGNLRFNLFRTSDYDITVDNFISRSGVGISWRKPFDNFSEFIHNNSYNIKKQKEKEGRDTLSIKPNTSF